MGRKKVDSKIPQITFIVLLGLLFLVSFLIAKPFLIAVISGALLAFIFYPVYVAIEKKLKKKTLAAIITTIIILFVIALPLLIMGNIMAKETGQIFKSVNEKISSGELIPERCDDPGAVCQLTNKVYDAASQPETKVHITNFLQKVIGFMAEKIGKFIMSIPGVILSLAIALFTAFYLLRDGQKFISLIKKIAPMKLNHQTELFKQLKDIIKALVFGTIIVAIIQGLLTMLAFFVFGVPNPIWWGSLTMFFALIPFIGAWLIWFPGSLYLFITGYIQHQNSLIWRGIGLAIFGLLIISQIDNFLKPILIGGKAKVHPLLILIGVLGGLILFGFIGIILGPIILAMLQKIIQIYAKEITPHIKEQPGILGKHHK